MRIRTSDLRHVLSERSGQLEELRQTSLKDASSLRSWCDDRSVILGLQVIEAYWRRGLLLADSIQVAPVRSKRWSDQYSVADTRAIGEAYIDPIAVEHISPQFHVFRAIVVAALRRNTSVTISYKRDVFLQCAVTSDLDEDTLMEADELSAIADLAVLLEPCYWPWITSHYVGWVMTDHDSTAVDAYHNDMLGLVKQIPLDDLVAAHARLCNEARKLDENTSLYLALRCASWDAREKLKNRLGLALWYRHIAEVIRRATEEAHKSELPEEDYAPGFSSPHVRERMYGTLRPLDYPARYMKALLHEFHLDSAVIVRWYVEGDTEEGYLNAALDSVKNSQVEIVNLRGRLAGPQVTDWITDLERDIEAERFSFVSIDGDVVANVEAVRRAVERDLISGIVFVHEPDFEFANFGLDELIDAAILYDATDERVPVDSTERLRNGNWDEVRTGAEFAKRYEDIHGGIRGQIKGRRWGKVLYEVHAARTTSQRRPEKPIDRAISAALRSQIIQYSFNRTGYTIDAKTFANIERPKK